MSTAVRLCKLENDLNCWIRILGILVSKEWHFVCTVNLRIYNHVGQHRSQVPPQIRYDSKQKRQCKVHLILWGWKKKVDQNLVELPNLSCPEFDCDAPTNAGPSSTSDYYLHPSSAVQETTVRKQLSSMMLLLCCFLLYFILFFYIK